MAIRRISWIDQRIRGGVSLRCRDFEVRFWGSHSHRVGTMSDRSHHGEGEHHKRDVATPAMPGAGFIVIEPELIFCGLETIFDRPAMSFDLDQDVYARAGRTPGREERQVSIGDVAANQQPPGPGPVWTIIERLGVEVRQFDVGPVVEPGALGPFAGGKPLPYGGVELRSDRISRAGDRLFVPGAEVVLPVTPST